MCQVLCVLDTKAGPNLIRSSCCPEDFLARIETNSEVVNLRSASQHRLDVVGIVPMYLKIGVHTARVTFAVMHNLGADVFLGREYLDRKSKGWARKQDAINTINQVDVKLLRDRNNARDEQEWSDSMSEDRDCYLNIDNECTNQVTSIENGSP